MGSFATTWEIAEEKEDLSSFIFPGRTILPNSGLRTLDEDLEDPVLKLGYKGSLEDDINQLFESISIQTSGMIPAQQVGTKTGRSISSLGKNNALKKPVNNAGAPRSQGAGTSEPVSLKQALRDLCISKASEMAATKRVSEAGRVKNLHGSVLVESGNGPIVHIEERKTLMIDILEESKNNSSENASQQPHTLKIKSSGQSSQTSPRFTVQATQFSGGIMATQNRINSISRNLGNPEFKTDILQKANNVYATSESHPNTEYDALGLEKPVLSSTKLANATLSVRKVRLLHTLPTSSTVTGKRVGKLSRNFPRVAKPVLRNKVSVKNKTKQSPNPVKVYAEVDGFYDPITKHLLCHRCHSEIKNASKEESDHSPEPGLDSLTMAVKKEITEADYSPEPGLDCLNVAMKKDIAEETGLDFSGSENLNLDVKKDTKEETNQDFSGLDNVHLGVQKRTTEETNQDSGASRNSNPGVKKVITKVVTKGINQDFSGLDGLEAGVKNFGGEESNHISSSCDVDSGVINPSTENNQDSLAFLFVDNFPEVGSNIVCSSLKNTSEEVKHFLSPADHNDEIRSDSESSAITNLENITRDAVEEKNRNLTSSGQNELLQGSKDSLGKHSSSTNNSEESNVSRSSFGNRPHMSKDLRWEAIQHVRTQHGVLGLRHFNLLKKLGCGDIGTVYLTELIGTSCSFAIKVMDNDYLERRNKMVRTQTERETLKMLDHPFLPTLYAHFTSDDLSCLVMEYCPGGDLHVLRQKQPARCFLEPAARFYVAEVLLALEYLHMLGVIYRDLKPENILVREDGHIMVTDFDLSLRWTVSPILHSDPIRLSSHGTRSSCIDPFCMQPSVRVPSFIPKLLPTTGKGKKKRKPKKPEILPRLRSLPQLVAEPTDARSNSFVGTHEYLAPEIIKGEGHGAAVDWWTFGILLYEILYGKTPFKGSSDEETLANVVLQTLKFPDSPPVSFQAKDLVRGLLVKEPENRLGSAKGAADIKRHPFFEGLNWALIRCAIPPELPDIYDFEVSNSVSHEGKSNYLECKADGEHLEFELF